MQLTIVVSGSRHWKNEEVVKRVFDDISLRYPVYQITLIHGNCQGLDKLAGICASKLGWQVIVVPAEWNKYGKAAGPLRNSKMLDMKPNLVLLFHEDIERSRGTKDMLSQCIGRNLPYELYRS